MFIQGRIGTARGMLAENRPVEDQLYFCYLISPEQLGPALSHLHWASALLHVRELYGLMKKSTNSLSKPQKNFHHHRVPSA